MNERLLKLRTQELKMSQEEFGSKLGVTRAAISRYESGARALSETIILAICREFHVNYYWLTDGEGEIFTKIPDSAIDDIVDEYGLDEDDEKMLRKWLVLPADHRKIIKDYLRSIFT